MIKSINVSVLVIGFIVDLFLLVNGKTVFGTFWTSAYSNAVEIYLVMLVISVAISFNSESQISLSNSIIVFVPVFIVSLLTFSQIFHVPHVVGEPLEQVILTILFQITVVSLTEELLFRFALFNLFGGNVKAIFLQAMLFAVFHITAYSLSGVIDWTSILVAFGFGVMMGVIMLYSKMIGKESSGLAVCWAIHAAWNLSISLSIFSIGI